MYYIVAPQWYGADKKDRKLALNLLLSYFVKKARLN